jgi:hypothetical protein
MRLKGDLKKIFDIMIGVRECKLFAAVARGAKKRADFDLRAQLVSFRRNRSQGLPLEKSLAQMGKHYEEQNRDRL